MCIICIKEAGKDLPTETIITRMWNGNPDGAGFMFPAEDGVHIRKGFMTMSQFMFALDELKQQIDITNTPVIMHFRIGTHGGNTGAQTHPFPVSGDRKDLKATRIVTPVGFAHNGIIRAVADDKEMSDTMMYSLDVLDPLMQVIPDFYTDARLLSVIERTINDSRMCFMDKDGVITKVGDWITDNDTGLIYSNAHYKPYYESYYGRAYGYGWGYDDYDYDGYSYTNHSSSATKTNSNPVTTTTAPVKSTDKADMSWVSLDDRVGHHSTSTTGTPFKKLSPSAIISFDNDEDEFARNIKGELYVNDKGYVYILKDGYFRLLNSYCPKHGYVTKDPHNYRCPVCGEMLWGAEGAYSSYTNAPIKADKSVLL